MHLLCWLDNMGSNPGLAALWEDERQRRRDVGQASQIGPQESQGRCGRLAAVFFLFWFSYLWGFFFLPLCVLIDL